MSEQVLSLPWTAAAGLSRRRAAGSLSSAIVLGNAGVIVWLWIHGGNWTLASYGDRFAEGKLDLIPDEHWRFLEEFCIDWYEIDSHFFVHANVDPDLPLEEQPLYLLHWEPLFETRPHFSGKVMVCGHTKQRSGLPRNLGHAVCLDTWVYGDGWLTCLDVMTGQFWQANRHGEFRTSWLGEPEEGEELA